ncbi:ubiquinol oxidase 2, mitochondrial [Trifolium repens]|nr:ubiquinol oxidase 2, mitochondrial [Trifolium repens]
MKDKKLWETYQSNLSTDLSKHYVPKNFLDKVANRIVKLLRIPTKETDFYGLFHLVKFYKSRRFDLDIGPPKYVILVLQGEF